VGDLELADVTMVESSTSATAYYFQPYTVFLRVQYPDTIGPVTRETLSQLLEDISSVSYNTILYAPLWCDQQNVENDRHTINALASKLQGSVRAFVPGAFSSLTLSRHAFLLCCYLNLVARVSHITSTTVFVL